MAIEPPSPFMSCGIRSSSVGKRSRTACIFTLPKMAACLASDRGVGVPVFFRSAPAGVTGAEPALIDLTQADHSVVVPLVDRKMFEAADQGWEALLSPRYCRS